MFKFCLWMFLLIIMGMGLLIYCLGHILVVSYP